ncbi:unnamed protein product, partial [Ascophyllum nodosum]
LYCSSYHPQPRSTRLLFPDKCSINRQGIDTRKQRSSSFSQQLEKYTAAAAATSTRTESPHISKTTHHDDLGTKSLGHELQLPCFLGTINYSNGGGECISRHSLR